MRFGESNTQHHFSSSSGTQKSLRQSDNALMKGRTDESNINEVQNAFSGAWPPGPENQNVASMTLQVFTRLAATGAWSTRIPTRYSSSSGHRKYPYKGPGSRQHRQQHELILGFAEAVTPYYSTNTYTQRRHHQSSARVHRASPRHGERQYQYTARRLHY